MSRSLYNRPKYYDVAFSWDPSAEVRVLNRLFGRYSGRPVRSVLEPGCGTGRMLIALAQAGYRPTGYDLSPVMVAYAQQRIKRARVQAQAVVADMRAARLRQRFDAACNLINTISYLLTDEEIVGHLRVTGAALRPGGVYVVQLACGWDDVTTRDNEGWVQERDGIRVRTIWNVDSDDPERKLNFESCRMDVNDHGRGFSFTERQTLRRWTLPDIKRLLAESGCFRLAAIHDWRRRVSARQRITGEMGNHFYVFRKL